MLNSCMLLTGATLIFVVQLVALPGKQNKPPQKEEIVRRPNPSQPIQESSSELQVQTLVSPSSCSARAALGDMVTVHYAGYFTNSLKFDSRSVLNYIIFLDM